jgi:hypothetical protein
LSAASTPSTVMAKVMMVLARVLTLCIATSRQRWGGNGGEGRRAD